MARTASPWFWEERGGWYVNKDGQRHFLGNHPDGASAPKKTKGKWNAPEPIRLAFHALMAAPPAEAPTVKPGRSSVSATDALTVAELFDKYLEWCRRNREARTFNDYVWHLQKFCDHLKDTAKIPALDLRPFHVNEYLDANPEWGQTYRRNAIASVKRAYAWGEAEGHISGTPLKNLKKPSPARREEFVKPEDWEKIKGSYKDGDPFRELLEFCWETGARPHEARGIQPRHVMLDRAIIAIPPEEAKGRKRWRVIRLEGRALEIVKKRLPGAKEWLFVNRDGLPWKVFAINCRFCRLKEKLGVKFCNYQFRHGFANRMLVSGADFLTVAALMGHSDGTMLAKVYQHLDQSDDHLREALRRASGKADVA
jgi:integrase